MIAAAAYVVFQHQSGRYPYFINQDFFLYIQWLNPGYNDPGETWDRLGLVNKVVSGSSVFSIRNGKIDTSTRVQEMREFIYGWAKYRNLFFA